MAVREAEEADRALSRGKRSRLSPPAAAFLSTHTLYPDFASARPAFAAVMRQFEDPQLGHDLMVHLRWPGGVTCPRRDCGSSDVATIERRSKWRCRRCTRQFSVKIETLFEDSPIGFDKWVPTLWLVANSRSRISSCELGRMLGVTQKTAWSMLHRLRLALETEEFDRALSFEGDVPAETARAAAASWSYD